MSPDASNEELAPPESTADGTQQVETRNNSIIEVLTPVNNMLGSSPIQNTIDYILQTHPRSLGGEIVTLLIAATTRHLTLELDEKKKELSEARGKAESMHNQISQKDTTIAVQKEKITTLSQGRHFNYLLVTFGTALMGFAFDLFRKGMNSYALPFGLIGLVIIIGTWFFTPKGGEK